MKFHTYATDLQILPETPDETNALVEWARENEILGTVNFTSTVSNVSGQDWFGKVFYEIPFGSGKEDEIDNFVKGFLGVKRNI